MKQPWVYMCSPSQSPLPPPSPPDPSRSSVHQVRALRHTNFYRALRHELPLWSRGYESSLQSRRHWFDPQSENWDPCRGTRRSTNRNYWAHMPQGESLSWSKRPWCWERQGRRGRGDSGWDASMASSTPWMWVWANSGRWRRTGKPGGLQSTRWQGVRHSWATEQQQWHSPIISDHIKLEVAFLFFFCENLDTLKRMKGPIWWSRGKLRVKTR